MLKPVSRLLGCTAAFLATTLAQAQTTQGAELWVYAGGGKQLHTDNQHNQLVGVDVNMLHHQYSDIQTWSLGAGITHLKTDQGEINELVAVSVYPQLTLKLPTAQGIKPFFFVRALGPTYLSARGLGERRQAYSWAFQSQVGVGAYLGNTQQWTANVSFRHYSNADTGKPNEGIDGLLIFTLGHRF
ncbi:acyloxyacyl hydrolase [Simiduia sp. 21SJ11W-1]|uniref:acyloxyacyl hydrolase n=1 Tax=Simiduia sp. 21SJ11W-1 TaxID=2909669 RepID=UPI00209DA1BC|nr:acyloxyacyl hydrolase [Simiduia sp. 21SJ11W-1]UTA47095.1 acyloxyacyl hydrolase [Simiduia sp. 21SJ11W-1]